MRQCTECKNQFEFTEEERVLHEKIAPVIAGKKYTFPEPELCPDCRQQLRSTFRNERHLHKRKCDATGKEILSIYGPNSPYPVYHQEEWGSDRWEGLDYAKEIDFQMPFFDQLQLLRLETPRSSVFNLQGENVEYCHRTSYCKDCYLTFSCSECENTHYSYWCYKLKDCFDCFSTFESEQCYECVFVKKSHGLYFAENCENVRESYFCYDCKDVEACIGCVGLRKKQYCIFNKQYTKAEFERKQQELQLHTREGVLNVKKIFENLKTQCVRCYLNGEHVEDSTGDYLRHTKSSTSCFDADWVENCINLYSVGLRTRDSLDVSFSRAVELSSYGVGISECASVSFGIEVAQSANVFYSDMCVGCRDCFGCVGLKKKQYCILNKQYTKEEYEVQVPKLIAHMQRTGEWGNFFPNTMSPFGYNETPAQEYYPLTEENAVTRGWAWRKDHEVVKLVADGINILEKEQIPSQSQDLNRFNDIHKKILLCDITHKPFKVIPQEVAFYVKHSLPLPTRHPDQRHFERMALRNPRKLWPRSCMCGDPAHTSHAGTPCAIAFQTTYAPDRSEKVYCEECYQSEIY